MAVHMDESHDQTQQLARLRQFTFWLLLVSVGSLLAVAVLALIFPAPVTAMMVVLVVCFVLLVFVAHMQARHGRILPAIFLLSSGILVVTLAGVLVIPGMVSMLVLLS